MDELQKANGLTTVEASTEEKKANAQMQITAKAIAGNGGFLQIKISLSALHWKTCICCSDKVHSATFIYSRLDITVL